MENELNLLSTKQGFNAALRHFKVVSRFVSEMAEGNNLADLINESLDEGEIEKHQVRAILNALAVDKFGYDFKSHNIYNTISKIDKLVGEISRWNNIDFIFAYYNPEDELVVINPKIETQWESVLPLIPGELAVIYASASNVDDKSLSNLAISDFLSLLYGKSVKPKKEYLGEEEKPVSKEQVHEETPVLRRRATPRYSVQVTNELFHNGNVEAWKKIIESYKTKYPDLDVRIWYENERINDINALFKWGKVKHGGLIFFSVVGENIKDVSKLQRYLFEGASPRFEAFLKGGIGKVLDLF